MNHTHDELSILRHVRRSRGRWVCTDNMPHEAIARLIEQGFIVCDYRPDTGKCFIREQDDALEPIDLKTLIRAQIRPFNSEEDTL